MIKSKIVLTFLLCQILGLMLVGCTTTGTDSLISDSTVKAMTEAVAKLDKDQVKKLEEAIKEKLKNEESIKKTSPEEGVEEGVKEEIASGFEDVNESMVEDAFPLENLKINVSVDSPQLIRHYTNGWTTEHPWALMKDLPVTVTIKSFNSGGIELEGVPQGKYENDRWERTSCFWAFDENGMELGYEDNAYTSYPEPGKFYGKAKYILVVRCSDRDTFNALARSRVTEVR